MTGHHLEDVAEFIRPAMENEKVQDRFWQQVFREHPYSMIANGQHGKRVICGLRNQNVWSIMEKLGRCPNSFHYVAIPKRHPPSGARFRCESR